MKKWNAPALAAMIAGIAVVVYANTLWNGFALDDVHIIQQNARVHDLTDQSGIWLTPYWPMYGPELGLYRPVAIFAYAVQWAVGGGAAWLFHAVSIGLHALVSVLVFALLRRLFATPAAVVGAMVFAVHPVHVEAVANVVGQAELFAGAALLGALLIAVTREEGAALSWRRSLLLCALAGAGALAKESIFVLPALIVAVDVVRGRVQRAGLRGYVRELALPMVLLAISFAAVLVLRFAVLGSLTGTHIAPTLPFLRGEHRILVALSAVPEMFRLLLLPADLSSDYAPGVIVPVYTVTPSVVLGGVILLGLVFLASRSTRWPGAALAAAWILITILPTSNLLFPIGVVLAERLLYVPSVGVAVLAAAAWQAVRLRTVIPVRAMALAPAAVILLMGARTVVRNGDWSDTPTIVAALVRDHPESYRAQQSVGNALLASDPVKARMYLEMANATWPNDPFLLSQIGRLELADGNHVRAVELLERASVLAPFLAETEAALAYGYIAARRTVDALAALDRAERTGADPATVHALRAQAHEMAGSTESAAAAWHAAARHDDRSTRYWQLFARSLAHAGRPDAALAALDSARVIAPAAELPQLAAVEDAVRRGCYTSAANIGSAGTQGGCSDPLADARIELPGQIPLVRSDVR